MGPVGILGVGPGGGRGSAKTKFWPTWASDKRGWSTDGALRGIRMMCNSVCSRWPMTLAHSTSQTTGGICIRHHR